MQQRAPARRLEHLLQQAAATFLSRALPPQCPWTSVDPGQGKMSKAAAGQRKARGVKAGWPDIHMIWQGRFHGVELKVGNNGASPIQQQVAADIVAAGGRYAICTTIDGVERTLREWGIPLRATSLTAPECDARLAERAAKPKKPRKTRQENDPAWVRAEARLRQKGLFV